MARIYKHMSRQQEAIAVVALAFIAVVLYTLWGASLLNHERQANAEGVQLVVNR